MWEILLPMTEDCLALTKKDLQYSKSRIQRLEMYPDQRFWSAQFYPRPAGWRLLNAIWNHLKINPDKKIQEWHYYLMMDSKGFNINPPPPLDGYNDRRVSVIVSGWKLACWHCGESGHLSAPLKQRWTSWNKLIPYPPVRWTKQTETKIKMAPSSLVVEKVKIGRLSQKKEKAITPSNPPGDLLLMNQQNLMQR